MTGHPRYPGTDWGRPILIGDTAHKVGSMVSGTVSIIWDDGDITLKGPDGSIEGGNVPVDSLRLGPPPRLIELTIQPTRDLLRTWVAAHDEFGSEPELPRGHVIAAIPADLLAELRAEIAAERQL